MSWQPFVKVDGEDKWHTNSCVFATKEEAEKYAGDLLNRWWRVTDTKAEECDLPVNYVWDDTVGACRLPDEEEETVE